MKKGILVLIDLEENLDGILQYTFDVAKHLELDINLLNCYPKALYNRKFDFPNGTYAEGLTKIMSAAVEKYKEPYSSVKVKFIAAVGSEVDFVKKNSSDFDLISMRTQLYSNSINKFMNSNISYLTDASACPLMIVPPSTTFSGFENCWLLERKVTDTKTITNALKILKVGNSNWSVKKFNQNKYTSNLWKLLNSAIDLKSYNSKNLIAKELEKEPVDIIFLASYSQAGFKAFMDVNLARIIFQLGIPILICHKI